jgi:hypothetical protein
MSVSGGAAAPPPALSVVAAMVPRACVLCAGVGARAAAPSCPLSLAERAPSAGAPPRISSAFCWPPAAPHTPTLDDAAEELITRERLYKQACHPSAAGAARSDRRRGCCVCARACVRARAGPSCSRAGGGGNNACARAHIQKPGSGRGCSPAKEGGEWGRAGGEGCVGCVSDAGREAQSGGREGGKGAGARKGARKQDRGWEGRGERRRVWFLRVHGRRMGG